MLLVLWAWSFGYRYSMPSSFPTQLHIRSHVATYTMHAVDIFKHHPYTKQDAVLLVHHLQFVMFNLNDACASKVMHGN